MYACLLEFNTVCTCTIFSLLALHPYLEVTTTQGGVVQSVSDHDLHRLHVLTLQDFLPSVSQLIERLLEVLELRVLAQLQALLGHVLELLVLVVHQVLHQVLVHRVSEEDDLQNKTSAALVHKLYSDPRLKPNEKAKQKGTKAFDAVPRS